MKTTISLAEAKARFSAVVDGVLHRRTRYVIERHGKPVAAMVTLEDLQRLEATGSTADEPLGALALLGAWGDVADSEIDAFIADIRAARDADTGRPVEIPS
ncbi:MAG: type II toxin-antitoxin system Phd/YefM family antitoxin [Chloroflexi bacterium]|nr:type II toxin-antitoxin system Phd/YefM family antitoxin [Chloroflexota bacterium]MDA1240283.1 type II toxin-antitoxin system Phd/YefM family antitoxin [Chloroflexota bacterium]